MAELGDFARFLKRRLDEKAGTFSHMELARIQILVGAINAMRESGSSSADIARTLRNAVTELEGSSSDLGD